MSEAATYGRCEMKKGILPLNRGMSVQNRCRKNVYRPESGNGKNEESGKTLASLP